MLTDKNKKVLYELDELCPWCSTNYAIAVQYEDIIREEVCLSCQEKKIQDKKEKLMQNIKNNLIKRGIDRKHVNATLEDFDIRTQKLVESNTSYYIHGSVGTGKTHLAVALFREGLLNFEFESEFIYMNDLLSKIKSTFANGSEITEFDITEHFSIIPALYIDDMGVEKPTEWVLMKINSIIDCRYRKELKTIITSNLSLNELAEKLGDRTASRITEMCNVIQLAGKDRRRR